MMDRFEKHAEYIMKRGDKILAKKEKNIKTIRRISFSFAGVFAAVIIVFCAWKSTPPKIEIPSDIIISENTTIPNSTYTDSTSPTKTSLINSSYTTNTNINQTTTTTVPKKTETVTTETISRSETEQVTAEQTETQAPATTALFTEPPIDITTEVQTFPNNPGNPGAVHTVLNVSYDEAKEKFEHSIKKCTSSDFLGYKVGIVSQNGNINSKKSFCLDLTYEFTNGHIYIQDQDRSVGKIANHGIEQYDYLGRTFVKENSYDDEFIIIGYYPTDMDGFAYRASFAKSVDVYEIMDKIISIEI